MPTNSTASWEPLERWNATAFLVAGGLLLGYAGSKVAYVLAVLPVIGAVDVAYGGLALLVTLVALFGLYPRLRDHAPRLSLAGLATAAVATACTLALEGWLAAATLQQVGYPAVPEEAPAWTVPALIVTFVTIALSFLAFGVASLRTDELSRPVGALLVVPGLGWVGLIVGNLVLTPGQYLGFVYFPISGALLAVGYLFRVDSANAGHAERRPDSVP